ncbi:MAG: peptidoglycan-binding domain-containing protein, partial [Beijerinckiaceae bacterium]
RSYSLGDLTIQVGAAKAAEFTAASAGDPNAAYRSWLKGYIDRKIQPSRFRRGGTAQPAVVGALAAGPENPEELRAYADIGAAAQAVLRQPPIPPVAIEAIGGDARLAKAVQEALSFHGYLDPPADGDFGPVSHWALAEFAARNRLDLTTGFTAALGAALADPARGLPAMRATGSWIDNVIRFMSGAGYFICRHPQCWNIVYVEGMSADGAPNPDRPNAFNDLRIAFRIDDGGLPEVRAWDGTTEPGSFFTSNPENSGGAARIAMRQFKSWSVGIHKAGTASEHEALVQSKTVTVHRDFNKDHMRTGDRLDRGVFGINQHWGGDAAPDDIGLHSAGCLVGRTKTGHRQFMALVRKDARYVVSKGYRFVAAIVPGDKLGL